MNDPRIIAVATATPPHAVAQADVRAQAARHFAPLLRDDPRLLDVFDNADIATRHLSAPVEWLFEERSFAAKNARYVDAAVSLGCDVAQRVLERAHLAPGDIDHILFVSSTGIAT
ncbi:MAG TPA: type III polyketide synthase, partial [Candidatus Krumholzibacteria bacterium]|nr:type III polyketide synthase [Candidatus Krumholzibacteria bacterium]